MTITRVTHCVGGVISPVLSNIYLNRLDQFVETVLIPAYTRGKYKAVNPAYQKVKARTGDGPQAR